MKDIERGTKAQQKKAQYGANLLIIQTKNSSSDTPSRASSIDSHGELNFITRWYRLQCTPSFSATVNESETSSVATISDIASRPASSSASKPG